MRIRCIWTFLTLAGLVLTACGTPEATPAVAQLPIVQTGAISTTTAPTATIAPTSTTAPTATIPPTNTAEPTAEPTIVPTPEPTPEPVEVATEPVRLQIPDIGLDYNPIGVGLDRRNVPVVLDHDVAWYNLSAKPGQGDNVVFWAHVLRFKSTPKIAAPFARVHELKQGAQIIVTTASGKELRYQVTQAVRVKPSDVHYILPTGKEQITLVSCIGDKVIENGFVTKAERLVTIAEPIQ